MCLFRDITPNIVIVICQMANVNRVSIVLPTNYQRILTYLVSAELLPLVLTYIMLCG